MGIRFSNNAKTNLAASITATDLILTVTPTTGAKFPVLIGTDDNYCVVTLEDAAGNREFVKVSRRTSDTLGDGTYPCVRGYWGSTPRVWASATTTVDIRWAADAVQDYLQNISGRYLGAYAADPTTDSFGAALKTGDLYYDTAGSVLKKYASGAWGSAYLVNAASTTFTPAGGLAATNVQAALQELDSEKANVSALSSYQTVAGMSSYQTVAGMSAYQTVAGMSAYQTVAGMSNYQTVAGMPTASVGYAWQVTSNLASGVIGPTYGVGDNSTKIATTAHAAAAGVGGVGQSWQNVGGSRALYTSYTNSTGRPIMVSYTATIGSGSNGMLANVGGVTIYGPTVATVAVTVGISFIVPNGVAYYIYANNGLPTNATTQAWNELR